MPYDLTDRRMSSVNEGTYGSASLVLRRLPPNTTAEAVRTMLLFTKDLHDAEIVPNDRPDDQGFVMALARFSSLASAQEAQLMLDGKPNTDGSASMSVEIANLPTFSSGFRRNTIDPGLSRPVSQISSPNGRTSRYAFDSVNRAPNSPAISPPDSTVTDGAGGAFSGIPQQRSPRSSLMHDRARISGKSVISDEGGDEETDGLLRDPVGYMKKDNSRTVGRRQNGHQPPYQDFARMLSLNTNMAESSPAQYHTPRSAYAVQSPRTPFSPGKSGYANTNPYIRHNFPPANPADQNPPCNTLYVGNLPMDTSEDELKAMFAKQRGYKRLCFRTKQNGPMCFVEFEDVSFATKALNELYGAQLHNSVKGGIRLSFSKNPLGVRSGQPGSTTAPATPLNASGPSFVHGAAMSPGGLSIANGPPPGLAAPSGGPANGPGHTGQYVGLGMRNPHSGSGLTSLDANMYPDYMLGR